MNEQANQELQKQPLFDVTSWQRDDDYGTYPFGARDKELLVSPADVLNPLKKGFRYLFKKSNSRYPWQFWGEIIAYHVGQIVGVKVPLVFPAKDFSRGHEEDGALIEWFIDNSDYQRLVHGGEWMERRIPNYDTNKKSFTKA